MESKVTYVGENPKYDVGIFVRIDKELKKEVQKIALDKEESFSDVIRELLESYVVENRYKKRTIKSKKSV